MNLVQRTLIRIFNGKFDISGQADNELIAWNDATGEWQNQTAAEAGLGKTLVDSDTDVNTTLFANTSTTPITASLGVTVATQAGDIVQVGFGCNTSHDTALGIVGAKILRAGSTWSQEFFNQTVSASTSGGTNYMSPTAVDTSPLTGSTTYALYYRTTVGGGIKAYLGDRYMWAMVYR